MATWFEITFTGEPTEGDFTRVAELAAQGFTSGQLINEPDPDANPRPRIGNDPCPDCGGVGSAHIYACDPD